MSRAGFLLLHAANLLVAGSGLVYAWMLYLLEPVDEFALWNHPWQGAMRDLHLLAAPLLVLLVGAAMSVHALPRLRGARRGGARTGRRTGTTMLVAFLPMALSGSLLQTAVSPAWTTAWLVVHLASSALWTLATVAHLLGVRRRRGERRRAPAAAVPAD